MVRVREIPWDGRVEGLGEGARAPLPDGPLEGAVARAVARAGAREASGPGPGLVIPGGTALGPKAIAAAARLGASVGHDCQIRLGGRLGELLEEIAMGGEPARVAWLADTGGDQVAERVQAAPVVELDPVERRIPIEVLGRTIDLPLSDLVILPVRHWLQLLWADLLLLGPWLWHSLLSPYPAMAALKLGWGAMRSLSVQPERIAAALTVRGPGSRVHPSAIVEGCVLGPGATVGAGAVVRGAVLGPGARVEELALCEGVVLGASAVVQRQAMLKFGVMADGAMIGGVTQLSVFGAGSALKRGAYGMDQSLGGSVRVRAGGRLVVAPLGLAGVCLGERALVGCGVRVAPGRVVPPEIAVAAPGALTHPEALVGPLAVLSPGKGSDV